MELQTSRVAFAENAVPTAINGASVSQPDARITSDFDTFLQLLTAQLRNQDPLNPTSNEDFATQLATFSNVEQNVLTNDLLQTLNGFFAQTQSGALLGYVGMEVRAPGPARYEGAPINLHVNARSDASEAVLNVYNENDELILRQSVEIGQTDLTWDGSLANGGAATHGVYRFEYEQVLPDADVTKETAEVFGYVVEARRGPQGFELVTEAGGQFGEDQVSIVRKLEEGTE